MDTKRCAKCGLTKPLVDFYVARGMRDGHRNDCIDCNKAAKRDRQARNPEPYRERARRWAKENPERRAAYQAEYRNRPERKRSARDAYFRRMYGISADDVDAMLEAQGGGCAICGERPERLASLHVDHDHEYGHLRGLLCLSCNQGLGQFRDDPEVLLAAIEYLRRTRRPSLGRSVASLAGV